MGREIRIAFSLGVHDVRRFVYITSLLELLVTRHLTSLPGCAQRVLFDLLEEILRKGWYLLKLEKNIFELVGLKVLLCNI